MNIAKTLTGMPQ